MKAPDDVISMLSCSIALVKILSIKEADLLDMRVGLLIVGEKPHDVMIFKKSDDLLSSKFMLKSPSK